MACFNPISADRRRRKRQEPPAAGGKEFGKIARQVGRRTPTLLRGEEIALQVGEMIGRYKLGKHFRTQIEDGRFAWSRDRSGIGREEKPDGIYIVRTGEDGVELHGFETLSAELLMDQGTFLPERLE